MNDTSTTVRLREDVFPLELREREEQLINQRRSLAGVLQEDQQVGIALSGGGIRSATFCLGLFQGLARRGLVRRMDYLSTVSGGGYFGSFLGRLFTRPWINGEQPAQSAPKALPPLARHPQAAMRRRRVGQQQPRQPRKRPCGTRQTCFAFRG